MSVWGIWAWCIQAVALWCWVARWPQRASCIQTIFVACIFAKTNAMWVCEYVNMWVYECQCEYMAFFILSQSCLLSFTSLVFTVASFYFLLFYFLFSFISRCVFVSGSCSTNGQQEQQQQQWGHNIDCNFSLQRGNCDASTEDWGPTTEVDSEPDSVPVSGSGSEIETGTGSGPRLVWLAQKPKSTHIHTLWTDR